MLREAYSGIHDVDTINWMNEMLDYAFNLNKQQLWCAVVFVTYDENKSEATCVV